MKKIYVLDTNVLLHDPLAIFPDQQITLTDNIPFLNGNHDHANDNRIINVGLSLQAIHPRASVCLVTVTQT